MKLLGLSIAVLVAAVGYLMSPFFYGHDGYLGSDPQFSGFAIERRKHEVWVCIHSFRNCRVLYHRGDKHVRVGVCNIGGEAIFCKAH